MSDQSYFFNPEDDRTALTGVGFQGPRLPTAIRTSLSLSDADAGMTVYDITLRQMFVWNGSAWREVQRKLFNPAEYGASFSWWAARLESYSNGQDVPTWTDRGDGTLTVSAAAGQEPTFHTAADPIAPNGYPFIRWVNGDRLLNGATGITGPWTSAVVFRPTALLTSRVPVIGGNPTIGTSGLKLSTGSLGSMLLYCGNTVAMSFAPSSPVGGGYQPISPLGWQVVVGTFHNGNANQGMTLLKSGLTAGTSPNNFLANSTGTGTGQDVAPGVFCVGGNTYVGEIAEAAVWRQTMNESTRISIGKSLAAMYGIQY